MTVDSLGDRMKDYESVTKNRLVRRMPAILRLDGRAFHTLTSSMDKPFDGTFMGCMKLAALEMVKKTQTAVFAYCQSDEISILLKDYSRIETEPYFGGQIQKIVSISAATCSIIFSDLLRQHFAQDCIMGKINHMQVFDARIFNIPKEDVCNYFIWRQKDATRNSINMLGQANFSHNELQGKSQNDVLDMLHGKGMNWNDLPTKYKRGFCIVRHLDEWLSEGDTYSGPQIHRDTEIPIFTENRVYVERFL
jgi:tRNA(His) guanylyltransferase